MLKKIADWQAEQTIDEMVARRSLARTMSKFKGDLNRPIAILTAFRQDLGLDTNRDANKKLERLFKQHGLSFYPVIGAGQEPDGENSIADEESYVVQPINPTMGEEVFLDIVRTLLFNPTGDDSTMHAQWGAVVKLPSRPKAFLLHHNEEGRPTSPDNYSHEDRLGKSARPARGKSMLIRWKDKDFPVEPDNFYTQMQQGPPASDTMRSKADDKRAKLPGRRFTVSKGEKF